MKTEEQKKAYLREWYLKNRQHKLAKAQEWQEKNREKSNAIKRAYAERNPDRVKEAQRKWYSKAEVKEKQRGDPKRLAYCRQRGVKHREELTDEYVRRCMAQHLRIKGSELPQVLVDAHREIMKIKRALNEKRE